MIDSSAATVYAFSSSDANTRPRWFFSSPLHSGWYDGYRSEDREQYRERTPQYNGAFDHNYINAATPTGNMYVCGNPGGNPTLYQIPISASVMGTPLV